MWYLTSACIEDRVVWQRNLPGVDFASAAEPQNSYWLKTEMLG